MLEQPLNGSARTLCSASWALVPPNSLRYQNLKPPSLSHPFHHASHHHQSTTTTSSSAVTAAATAAVSDEDLEATVSLCVLLQPREHEEQHTLVEVSQFGQAKLSELLALGHNTRPLEFLLPLTTVDGRREDDINITAKDRKEGCLEGQESPGTEASGSFRSLFETEGCPAPFVLGSRFYCFHCPGLEPLLPSNSNGISSSIGDNMLSLRPGGHEVMLHTVGLPPLPSVFHLQAEADRAEGGKSDRERESEEKLAVMYERLRVEVGVGGVCVFCVCGSVCV